MIWGITFMIALLVFVVLINYLCIDNPGLATLVNIIQIILITIISVIFCHSLGVNSIMNDYENNRLIKQIIVTDSDTTYK